MEGSRGVPDGMEAVVYCGPIMLGISADSAPLLQRARTVLEPFTARWTDACPLIRVHLCMTTEHALMGVGRFLHCANVRVDRTATGLVATCRSGAIGVYDSSRRAWSLHVHTLSGFASRTDAAEDTWVGDSVEDLFELVLTTAWRDVGWIALHAGAVVDGPRCALLTAPAKGGKTTLTVAMLQRGWRTLGDDKALVSLGADGRPEVRGLARRFNIDPHTCTWFPELGNLEVLPPLSRWNAKRRVMIDDVWAHRFADRAEPTHVVSLRRSLERRPARVTPLSRIEVLSALLHQTVIPNDPSAARVILKILAQVARTLRGLRFDIGDDAYSDPSTLDGLDTRLQ